MAEVSIDRAFGDRRLFASALGDLSSWSVWRCILKAAFALPLTAEEQQLFTSVAGQRAPPKQRVKELWAIAGRRSGKSRMAALIAIYLALFIKYKLSPGEKPKLLVIAGSLDQAAMVFNYVRGYLEASPALAKEVAGIKRHEIELKNGVIVGVHSNSYKTVRGRTLVGVVLDEVSFWRDEDSSLPDIETYRAILPSLATTGGLVIGISTPYRKLGLLHQKHRDHFGVDNDTLVVKGASKLFNPTLSDATIAAQRAADPAAAASEWDAEFRDDISGLFDDALLDAAVEHGRPLELAPFLSFGSYYQAFCDAAGGSGGDSYTLAVAHKENEHYCIDLVRGTIGRFDPAQVTKQYAELLSQYGCTAVTGDCYAGEWVSSAWQQEGITYTKAELPKSQIYLETLPLFTRGLVRLPDHPKLLRELRLLERYTHRGGKDTVDHPRGGHDDYANSVCGVLFGLSSYLSYNYDLSWISGQDNSSTASDRWARWRLHQYLRRHGVPV